MSNRSQTEVNKKIESEVAAVTKPAKEILKSIHESVYDLNASDPGKISQTMARFATLQVHLSEEAARESEKNLALQRTLVRQTHWLIIFTIAMFLVGGVQIILAIIQIWQTNKPH